MAATEMPAALHACEEDVPARRTDGLIASVRLLLLAASGGDLEVAAPPHTIFVPGHNCARLRRACMHGAVAVADAGN